MQNAANVNDILAKFEVLSKNKNIRLGSSIVPMIGLTGEDDFLKTICTLSRYFQYVDVLYPGYTKYSPTTLAQHMKCDHAWVRESVNKLASKGLPVFMPEWNWDINPDDMKKALEKVKTIPQDAILFTSAKALPSLLRCQFPLKAVAVPNIVYGEMVETYGLLTFQDFQSVVDQHPEIDHFVFPCTNFLNDFGNDLMGSHLFDFENNNPGKTFHFLLEKSFPYRAYPPSVSSFF
jgi:hypothetical protein